MICVRIAQLATWRYHERRMAEQIQWANRILSYGTAKASTFKANPLNWRKHPTRQSKALKGSLDTLGWVQTIIVNKATGFIVDGHERVEAALRNGDAEVPYILVDLSPEEEAQALLSLDAIAALAQTDASKVDELLRMVDSGNAKVQEFLSNLSLDVGLTKFDPTAEWEGMPEYEAGEQQGNREIILHFATDEDVQQFASMIGQVITDKTKWLWHPARESVKRQGIDSYKDES